MKRLIALLFVIAGPVAIWIGASGFTINGAAPGSTASMTPVAVGSSAPVAIINCSTPQPNGIPVLGFSVCASATGCYMAPAPVASPCAAASPAPNQSTKAGFPIQTCAVGSTVLNAQMFGGNSAVMQSEWDAECATAATSIWTNTLP